MQILTFPFLSKGKTQEWRHKSKAKNMAITLKKIKIVLIFITLSWFKLSAQQWYSQLNPIWASNLMNNTCPIGVSGCVVSDVAMYYNGNWSPGQLNEYLNTGCGYSGCSLIWASTIPAGLNYNGLYQVSTSTYLSQIAYQLSLGRKLILEFLKPNGGTHWINIISVIGSPTSASNFNVYDPGISTYQNRTLAHSSYATWSPRRLAVYALSSNSCNDYLEPNETFSNSASIATGYNINAVLCNSGDVDIYKFVTSSSQPKFKVTLSDLPSNYHLELYKQNTNGSIGFVNSSVNSCRSNENIICNQFTTNGTYYAKVYGVNQYAFHNQKQYTIKITTSSVPISIVNDEVEARSYSDEEMAEIIIVPDGLAVKISPNPIQHETSFKINISNNIDENASISIFNVNGALVYSSDLFLQVGDNIENVENYNLSPGMYFLRVSTQSGSQKTEKFIVIK